MTDTMILMLSSHSQVTFWWSRLHTLYTCHMCVMKFLNKFHLECPLHIMFEISSNKSQKNWFILTEFVVTFHHYTSGFIRLATHHWCIWPLVISFIPIRDRYRGPTDFTTSTAISSCPVCQSVVGIKDNGDSEELSVWWNH